MKEFLRNITILFSKERPKKDRHLSDFIENLTGKSPRNISLYQLAISHTSLSREKDEMIRQSNERLEFLGDAVLGAIIAEFLFKRFPFKDEGFLTEIRSRIVNGESLNALAKKVGLHKMVEYNTKNKSSVSHKSMYGDALEAVVGAVYLDRGFRFCKKFVLEKLLVFIDLEDVVSNDHNYKSKLINWGQSNARSVKFNIIEEKDNRQYKEFTAQVLVDNEPLTTGIGLSKKKAEQEAARKACEQLKM